jgi:hypothetical protein
MCVDKQQDMPGRGGGIGCTEKETIPAYRFSEEKSSREI